jgi:flagellar hook-associated protein 1 FlgK
VAPANPADDWMKITCLNLKVNGDLIDDPKLLAASNANNGESNNENAKLLATFRNKKVTGLNGTPDDFIKAILATLAVDTNHANRMTTNTESIVEQTNNSRLSISGVSLDEEMGNMVKFQHSYNASAKMVTTLDSIMDTMINRLGLVGR